MYILQKGICNYFREIDKNQNVILVNNACRSMFFNDIVTANKFKEVLFKDYSIKCVIIEI